VPDIPIFGAPEPEPPPLPPNIADCEESVTVNEDSNFCRLNYRCPDDELSADCTLEDDHFRCGCDGNFFSEQYDLTGVDVANACDVMRDVCFSGNVTEFDGAEQCEQSRTGDDTACDLTQRCLVSSDFGGGVTVRRVSSLEFADCYAAGGSQVACLCQVGGFDKQLLLDGTTTADACDVMFDVCSADPAPPFVPTEGCERSYSASATDFCNADELCTRTADLGAGVSAQSSTFHYMVCQDDGEDGWSCSCQAGAGYAYFVVPVASTPDATCGAALDLCNAAANLPPEDPADTTIACEDNARTTGANYCGHTDVCSIETTALDTQVTVSDYVYTSCYQTGEGAFQCSCSAPTGESSIAYTSSAALVDVCAEVAPECEATVDIRVEPN
jgi:hypothetical protein